MRRLRWLAVLPLFVPAACLPAPFLRRGPSEAHIEGARASDHFLVKGRAPYVIVPRISRTSSLRLGSGAIVRAEARDKVFAVTLRNDTGIEHWVSSFDVTSGPVPVFLCRAGEPAALALPMKVLPGEEAILVLRDDRERRDVRLIVRSLLDRAELHLRLDNGPPLAAGFGIIPFSVYDYKHLPRACRDAARR